MPVGLKNSAEGMMYVQHSEYEDEQRMPPYKEMAEKPKL